RGTPRQPGVLPPRHWKFLVRHSRFPITGSAFPPFQSQEQTMSQLTDRIAQFRKMANDDPDNELGHYRLGQLLMDDGQHDEAVQSFRRTLELSPQFSKVYHLLAQSLMQLGQRDE